MTDAENRVSGFAEKSVRIHGDKYDYSEVRYLSSKKKVKIVCPEHGPFFQTPNSHLKGRGCPECGKAAKSGKLKTEKGADWANECLERNGINARAAGKTGPDTYELVCPMHGTYEVSEKRVARGGACPKCRSEKMSRSKLMGSREFVEKAKAAHGEKYDYSKTGYSATRDKVTIICPEHGPFEQRASAHLNGNGCPVCGDRKIGESRKSDVEDFVANAGKIHGGKYDYSDVIYETGHENVGIRCPEHGIFRQTPSNHIQGTGCPKCFHGSKKSAKEREIGDFLKSLGVKTGSSDRILISPMELDLVVPEKKLAVVFNGSYWHSEKFKDSGYHFRKFLACAEKGYRLLCVFEYEWDDPIKKEIWKSVIKAKLGIFDGKIHARKTEAREIPVSEAREFLNLNHLQGYCQASEHSGLRDAEGNLLAVMSFGKPRFGDGNPFELVRYCPRKNTGIPGGAGKLFKRFLRKRNPESVLSYASNALSDGTMYRRLGFSFDGYTGNTNYVWAKSRIVLSRYRAQKHRLPDLVPEHFDPGLTETEIMENAGYRKIFGAGNARYVWKKRWGNNGKWSD